MLNQLFILTFIIKVIEKLCFASKLLLYVTYDFEMELLSYLEYVKVLKPESLIEELKRRHGNALARYRIKT